MNQDIGKKLDEVLKGVDKELVQNGKKRVEKMLKTPEGQKLRQQLGNVDKEQLLNAFMKMDTNEIQKKLKGMDLAALSGLSAEEILKKLR